MFDLEKTVRKNIRNLQPYSSSRKDFQGKADVWLDANENPFNNNLNRYPDPYQRELKNEIAKLKNIPAENIFLGNGSDEPIDLLIRAFCEPNLDKVLVLPPTYGIYKVSAEVNAVEILQVPLTSGFQLNMSQVLPHLKDPLLKLVFLCSPNNPTGNLLRKMDMVQILQEFDGIVVVDEAYIDFSPESSFLSELEKHPNLVVLQTLSKAWGLAGIRLGMAYASPGIIAILNKIKPSYNLSVLVQNVALEQLVQTEQVNRKVAILVAEREKLSAALLQIKEVIHVYPSAANFLLVQFTQPDLVYTKLAERGIVVRNRSHEVTGCLRITVGTNAENQLLLETLTSF
jgi:histidinol-phosphate aminotransferase